MTHPMQFDSRCSRRRAAVLLAALAVAAVLPPATAHAAMLRRHYYSSWSYYPSRTYYYSYYYYKPAATYDGYAHHYCVYYPSRPRYVYYYNPVRRVYWGRYDVEKKGYSMLAEKDRKAELDQIPESAFPAPGEMPVIPDAQDNERMLPIDTASLPSAKDPADAPAK